jgi:hypothetical protein
MVWVCGPAPQTPAIDAGGACAAVTLTPSDERVTATRNPLPGLTLEQFALGAYCLGVLAEHLDDRAQVAEYWPHFADQIALEEPFGRIREAIDEARGGAS